MNRKKKTNTKKLKKQTKTKRSKNTKNNNNNKKQNKNKQKNKNKTKQKKRGRTEICYSNSWEKTMIYFGIALRQISELLSAIDRFVGNVNQY